VVWHQVDQPRKWRPEPIPGGLRCCGSSGPFRSALAFPWHSVLRVFAMQPGAGCMLRVKLLGGVARLVGQASSRGGHGAGARRRRRRLAEFGSCRRCLSGCCGTQPQSEASGSARWPRGSGDGSRGLVRSADAKGREHVRGPCEGERRRQGSARTYHAQSRTDRPGDAWRLGSRRRQVRAC